MMDSKVEQLNRLLQSGDFKAVANVKLAIIDGCKAKISKCQDFNSKAELFLFTYKHIIDRQNKNKENPLYEHLLSITDDLMKEHNLIAIQNYKHLQPNDITLYCWKYQGNWYENLVVVNKLLDDGKVEIRYTHHPSTHGFEHKFSAKNFKIAIRLSQSQQSTESNIQFFFFNK